MSQLRMGDKVQTIDAQGASVFQDIFVFGERECGKLALYIQIKLTSLHGQSNHKRAFHASRNLTLSASPDHFLLTSKASAATPHTFAKDRRSTRAQDIRVGDTMWIQSQDALAWRQHRYMSHWTSVLWPPLPQGFRNKLVCQEQYGGWGLRKFDALADPVYC